MSTTGRLDLQWAISGFQASTQGVLNLQWSLAEQEYITLELLGAPTGLVGVLTITLATLDGVIVYPATTQGIEEVPASSGRYLATLVAPAAGDYFAIWTDGITTVTVELTVTSGGAVIYLPVAPGRVAADVISA